MLFHGLWCFSSFTFTRKCSKFCTEVITLLSWKLTLLRELQLEGRVTNWDYKFWPVKYGVNQDSKTWSLFSHLGVVVFTLSLTHIVFSTFKYQQKQNKPLFMNSNFEIYFSLTIICSFVLTIFIYQLKSYPRCCCKTKKRRKKSKILWENGDNPDKIARNRSKSGSVGFVSPARRFSLSINRNYSVEQVRKESTVSLIGDGTAFEIKRSSQVILGCKLTGNRISRLSTVKIEEFII